VQTHVRFYDFGLFGGELVLADAAKGTFKIGRDVLPLGTGSDAALDIAFGLIIDPTADVANVFHSELPPFFCFVMIVYQPCGKISVIKSQKVS
jgi:hypothetical protein